MLEDELLSGLNAVKAGVQVANEYGHQMRTRLTTMSRARRGKLLLRPMDLWRRSIIVAILSEVRRRWVPPGHGLPMLKREGGWYDLLACTPWPLDQDRFA
ncbi:unnamed protein product [Linum trigynum]|uniref:Uncharacterized protein n=1 Tax=Linum trigynum TaxID=586398 RepID=A0AAV2GPX5_9ROSI